MSVKQHLQGLRARFDSLALRPPAAAPGEALRLTDQPASARQLRDWCHRGAGPGHARLWQPGAQPAVDLRLAVAALRAAQPTDASAWADAFARQIDGSSRLAALPGRAAGLAMRLGVKLHDAIWWRPRQSADPWDAGWVISTPPALRQLQRVWTPRRATLLLAEAGEFEPLRLALAALRQRQDDFRHPVRWLWVGGETELPPQNGLAVQRFTLG